MQIIVAARLRLRCEWQKDFAPYRVRRVDLVARQLAREFRERLKRLTPPHRHTPSIGGRLYTHEEAEAWLAEGACLRGYAAGGASAPDAAVSSRERRRASTESA